MTEFNPAMSRTEREGRLAEINLAVIGRACDDLEFRLPAHGDSHVAQVFFRATNTWVTQMPERWASAEMLDVIAMAVRSANALGRAEGKREIGAFLRNECGL